MQQGSVDYMLRDQSSWPCVKPIHLDTNDSNLQERACIEMFSMTDAKRVHSCDRWRKSMMRWTVCGNFNWVFLFTCAEKVLGHPAHLDALQ